MPYASHQRVSVVRINPSTRGIIGCKISSNATLCREDRAPKIVSGDTAVDLNAYNERISLVTGSNQTESPIPSVKNITVTVDI